MLVCRVFQYPGPSLHQADLADRLTPLGAAGLNPQEEQEPDCEEEAQQDEGEEEECGEFNGRVGKSSSDAHLGDSSGTYVERFATLAAAPRLNGPTSPGITGDDRGREGSGSTYTGLDNSALCPLVSCPA